MTEHQKKKIAPIIITVLLILYFIVYFGILMSKLDGIWRWLMAVVPAALAVVMIAVCVERIHEIEKGEEDDLSNY